MTNGFIHIGSLSVNVQADRKQHLEMLASLFTQPVRDLQKEQNPDISLYMVNHKRTSKIFSDNSLIPYDTMVCQDNLEKDIVTISTRKIRCVAFKKEKPIKMFIFIREPELSTRALMIHLFVVMQRFLLSLGRIYLHAAAIKFKNKISLFVGNGGAGKTTICLKLGQEGATIISDDYVLLNNKKNRFFVSGCKETFRVTEKTESHIFGRPLHATSVDYRGIFKKECLVSDFFDCSLYEDMPVDFLFFVHVGKKFRPEKISQQDALLLLMKHAEKHLRFAQSEDFDIVLNYFSRFVSQTEVMKLELSRDLSELNRVKNFLKSFA